MTNLLSSWQCFYKKSSSLLQKFVMTSKRCYDVKTFVYFYKLPENLFAPPDWSTKVVPPPYFSNKTSYLIPLLAAINKPVLCHPYLSTRPVSHISLGECHAPTIIWVSSKFKFIHNDKACVPLRLHFYYILFRGSAPPPRPTHTHGWRDLIR